MLCLNRFLLPVDFKYVLLLLLNNWTKNDTLSLEYMLWMIVLKRFFRTNFFAEPQVTDGWMSSLTPKTCQSGLLLSHPSSPHRTHTFSLPLTHTHTHTYNSHRHTLSLVNGHTLSLHRNTHTLSPHTHTHTHTHTTHIDTLSL